MAPLLSGASGLKKFRMHIVTKLTREMKPPNPSFQSASTSPASAMPQMPKIISIRVLKGFPVFLPRLSIKVAIPNTTVNTTRKLPLIRAINRIICSKDFFCFIVQDLISKLLNIAYYKYMKKYRCVLFFTNRKFLMR